MNEEAITILSLGAGVQSTALALMAERGMIDKPAAAIFADTMDEPKKVYEHLGRLKGMLSFPVVLVKHGHGLGHDFLRALKTPGSRCGQPPFHVRAPDMDPEEIERVLATPPPDPEEFSEAGRFYLVAPDAKPDDSWGANDDYGQAYYNWLTLRNRALNKNEGGMLWRQCTKEYKIQPIRREARRIMKAAGASSIIQQIGISTDESDRATESGVAYITNDHPLLRLGWSRIMCERWLWEEFGIKAPKSSCRYCPYRSNAGWRYQRDFEPEEFELSCQFDEAIRDAQGKSVNGAGIVGNLYVHRSCTPLRTANLADVPGQKDFGFEQECTGMCGF